MTEPFDVWWHLEATEGQQWLVARVPHADNQATQAETFDDLKIALKELIALSYAPTPIEPEEVVLGEFTEETEADFIESLNPPVDS